MDWVHCNHCYVQPGDVEMKKFFITNCGHTYCNECLQTNRTKECRICHIKYTTIPLTSKMNSEVEIYFHDPVKNLKKIIKILEFQQSHRIRFVSHSRESLRTYKSIKKENYILKEELDLFKKENIKLRNDLKLLKDEILQYKKKCKFPDSRFAESNEQPVRSQAVTTPRMHSYSQFLAKEVQRTTPTMASKNRYASKEGLMQENYSASCNSDFFIMSDSKSSDGERRTYMTPDIPRFHDGYRTNRTFTPDTNTPSTPDSVVRDFSQRDPLQRKVKIPSATRSGPSPSTRLGFQGLTLSRPTSTPNKETPIANKYFKYFK